MFVSNIWGIRATSFESLLASAVVGAFGGGSTEALGGAVVKVSLTHEDNLCRIDCLLPAQDVFFLHERAAKMGLYVLLMSWGSAIGPLCGGFIAEGSLNPVCLPFS